MNDTKTQTPPSGSCLHNTVDTTSKTLQELALWKKGAENTSCWGSWFVLPVAGLERLYPAVLAFLWPSSVASGLPQQTQEKHHSDWAQKAHPLCDWLMPVLQDRCPVSPCPRKTGFSPLTPSSLFLFLLTVQPQCSFSSSPSLSYWIFCFCHPWLLSFFCFI